MNDQFIQGVIFDWDKIDKDSYLKGIRAFKGVEKLDFNKPITFFVGENGSGKSTLLEALAVAHGFNPEGGTKNYVFSTPLYLHNILMISLISSLYWLYITFLLYFGVNTM